MFDLDAAKKLPDYTFKFQGKEHTVDTAVIVAKFGQQLAGVVDPDEVRTKVNTIFGLAFTTCEALLLVNDFGTFAKGYEELVGNLFGRTPSSPTTTDSVPTDSTPESASDSKPT